MSAHNAGKHMYMGGCDFMTNLFCSYYAALERTAFYEYATEEQIKMWTLNCEVYRRGMELVRPGIKCCDIAKEMTNVYHKYDLAKYRMFGYGHSTGIVNHYFGREKGGMYSIIQRLGLKYLWPLLLYLANTCYHVLSNNDYPTF